MIHYGTKRVERRVGYVADFCQICRCPKVFKLLRIGMAPHVNYISFGGGKLVAHMRECVSCEVSVVTDPLQYTLIEKQPNTDVEVMMQKTFPRLRVIHADRLAEEEVIKKDPQSLTAEARADFVIEPFSLLNPMIEQRFEASTKMDKQSGIGCLATLAVPVLVVWVASLIGKGNEDAIWLIALGVCVLLALYTLVQLHFAPGRYTVKIIIPLLAKALRPLEPSRDELDNCLSRCKTAGMKVGQRVKLDTLVMELAQTPLRTN